MGDLDKSHVAVVAVVNSHWSKELDRSGINSSSEKFSIKRSKEMGWSLEEEVVSSLRRSNSIWLRVPE